MDHGKFLYDLSKITYNLLTPNEIHNQEATRALMNRLFDHQMANLADFDCFSQVVFKDVDDYKRMKDDPWYKKHLMGDHEKFADTKRSMMTIGWITEFIRDGQVVDGMKDYDSGNRWNAVTILATGAAMLLPIMAWFRYNHM